MMRNFDFFEFTAVLIPGTILLFGISRFFPDAWGPAFGKEFTASEFGLFVILAYIAGQLVQAVAHPIEKKLRKRYGVLPTDSVRRDDQELLDAGQLEKLTDKIAKMLGADPETFELKEYDGNWYAVIRQVYAAVRGSGRNECVDLFNAHYVMFRGMALSFVLLLVAWTLILMPLSLSGHEYVLHWTTPLLLIVFIVCSLRGFFTYGEFYARELFVQFLAIEPGDKKGPDKPANGGEKA